jgi:hypothetical protein
MQLTHDQAFQAMLDRGYGPVSARGLLHTAKVRGRYVDVFRSRSSAAPWRGVQIAMTDDARTRYAIRDVTVTSMTAAGPLVAPDPSCPHRRGATDLDTGAWHCYACGGDVFDD